MFSGTSKFVTISSSGANVIPKKFWRWLEKVAKSPVHGIATVKVTFFFFMKLVKIFFCFFFFSRRRGERACIQL